MFCAAIGGDLDFVFYRFKVELAMQRDDQLVGFLFGEIDPQVFALPHLIVGTCEKNLRELVACVGGVKIGVWPDAPPWDLFDADFLEMGTRESFEAWGERRYEEHLFRLGCEAPMGGYRMVVPLGIDWGVIEAVGEGMLHHGILEMVAKKIGGLGVAFVAIEHEFPVGVIVVREELRGVIEDMKVRLNGLNEPWFSVNLVGGEVRCEIPEAMMGRL